MKWLRRGFGMASATGAAAVANVGEGRFDFEVVGEHAYQNPLQTASAGRVERGERVIIGCQLRYEINSHTHAPAVRVDTTSGRTVGYFPAAQAGLYASAFHDLERDGNIAECQGILVGGQPGKPSFGIWLDFKPKLLTGKQAD